MSASLKLTSQSDYLNIERDAFEKHEYYRGEITLMAGASLNHNRLKENLSVEVGSFLKRKTCQAFTSDMRLHIPTDEYYTYPDMVIVCGKLQMLDNEDDTLLNPTVIVEILSKSTGNYDRGEKFERYRSIESFKEYILIDSKRVKVEIWRKNDENLWTLAFESSKLNDVIEIKSIEFSLKMEDIYAQTVGLFQIS
jgi:Uma2 family endonuclease